MFGSALLRDLQMNSRAPRSSSSSKRKAETYKDVPIDAIRIGINATDPNSSRARRSPPMFGPRDRGPLAVVIQLAGHAISRDPGRRGVHKLIGPGEERGTPPAPSEVQTAMQLIPGSEKANIFATFNLLRAMQIASAFAPMPLPQDIRTEPGQHRDRGEDDRRQLQHPDGPAQAAPDGDDGRLYADAAADAGPTEQP